jgi:outer membrane protein
MQRLIGIFVLMWAMISCSVCKAQGNPGTDSMMTLQGCVDVALKNNLTVQTSDLTMQTAKVSRNQAMDNFLPNIGGAASQGVNSGKSVNPVTYSYVNQTIGTGNYQLFGSLPLFQGLYYQNSARQYQYAYEASKMDLQNQKDNITLLVLLAYLQVLSSQEQLAISREQADVDAKQVDRLDLQNQAGALLILSTLTDLKGQYAGDQVNITTNINTLETAKINLFQLLNIPYNRNIQFEPVPINLNLFDYGSNSDSIYQIALHNLPVIKSADLRVKSFQKALQASRGLYFPYLSLQGSVSSNYSSASTNSIPGTVLEVPTSDYVTVSSTNYPVITQQENFTYAKTPFNQQVSNDLSTSFGLSLNVPILNNLRYRNNVKLAKINLNNANLNANSARLVLQQQVEQAYQNMVAAYSQYKSFLNEVTAFTESFRSAEIRFNEGVITSDVYLIAKNNIDRANSSLAASKYNYVFRTKILDYYQGRLML